MTPIDLPSQTPLYHALQSDRYDRCGMIRQYQDEFDCRLVVMVDQITPASVTYFEELIYDEDASKDMHLMLATPGGDGETAVRLVRAAQARCRELTVVVPDRAKSAGTLLALGAHHILMGPTSDLGPVDPQLVIDRDLWAAKDIIAAVDDATEKVQKAPDTYPVHAALLGGITALMVQRARSALKRTSDIIDEAVRSNPDRDDAAIKALDESIRRELVDKPKSHPAVFGIEQARNAGLPVLEADPTGTQWKLIWRLWAKYFAMGPTAQIYESDRASLVNVP